MLLFLISSMNAVFRFFHLFFLGLQRWVLGEYVFYKLFGWVKSLTSAGKDQLLFQSKQNGVVFVLPNNNSQSLYLYGINPLFELLIHPFFTLDVGSVFLDIGSFIGYYSLDLVSRNDQIVAYAIEPNPQTFLVLSDSINFNKLEWRVIPINKAIGKKAWDIRFHMSWDTSSIVENDDRFVENVVSVSVISFDDLIRDYNIELDSIGLIKIDVEGFEQPILEQIIMHQSSWLKGMKVICEIWNTPAWRVDQTLSMMSKAGFSSKKLDDSNYLFVFMA